MPSLSTGMPLPRPQGPANHGILDALVDRPADFENVGFGEHWSAVADITARRFSSDQHRVGAALSPGTGRHRMDRHWATFPGRCPLPRAAVAYRRHSPDKGTRVITVNAKAAVNGP